MPDSSDSESAGEMEGGGGGGEVLVDMQDCMLRMSCQLV